jgi:hypothetical protein
MARGQGIEQPTIELFDPLVTRNPTPERELELTIEYEKGDESGFGDITLGGKALLFQSIERPALVTAGLELGLPTGSESRGLGGDFSVTPYVAAGIAMAPSTSSAT